MTLAIAHAVLPDSTTRPNIPPDEKFRFTYLNGDGFERRFIGTKHEFRNHLTRTKSFTSLLEHHPAAN